MSTPPSPANAHAQRPASPEGAASGGRPTNGVVRGVGYELTYKGNRRLSLDAALCGSATARELVAVGAMRLDTLGDRPDVLALGTKGTWDGSSHLDLGTALPPGSPLQDVIATRGPLPADAIITIIGQLAESLKGLGTHGAITPASVWLAPGSTLVWIDLALAPAICHALGERTLEPIFAIAPEVLAGSPASEASDVYGLGALSYYLLVGQPLMRGGPRPSDVRPELEETVDQLVARACAADVGKRFGSLRVFADLLGEALGERQGQPSHPSLRGLKVAPSRAARTATVDDTSERWLISKDRLDYGPYALADIAAQIDRGEILAAHLITDQFDGTKTTVGEHPLLAARVAQAGVRLAAARAEAQATAGAARKKRKQLVLGAIATLGAVAMGLVVYAQIPREKVLPPLAPASVADPGALAAAPQAQGTVTTPPPATKDPSGAQAADVGRGSKRPAGKRVPGVAAGSASADVATLDMSDEDADDGAGSQKLSQSQIYEVYSRYGRQLGACVRASGVRHANIAFSIDGPTGVPGGVRVNEQAGGALTGCIAGVVRQMRFPTVNGRRTNVSFPISY